MSGSPQFLRHNNGKIEIIPDGKTVAFSAESSGNATFSGTVSQKSEAQSLASPYPHTLATKDYVQRNQAQGIYDGVVGIDSAATGATIYDISYDGVYAYILDNVGIKVYPVTLAGEIGSIASDATIAGDPKRLTNDNEYIYVANDTSGILIFRKIDIGGTFEPVATIAVTCADVCLHGQNILLAACSDGFRTYDITDPENPTAIGINNEMGTACIGVFSVGTIAFGTFSADGIATFSVPSTGNPVKLDDDDQGGYYGNIRANEKYIVISVGSSVFSYSYTAAGILSYIGGVAMGGSYKSQTLRLCDETVFTTGYLAGIIELQIKDGVLAMIRHTAPGLDGNAVELYGDLLLYGRKTPTTFLTNRRTKAYEFDAANQTHELTGDQKTLDRTRFFDEFWPISSIWATRATSGSAAAVAGNNGVYRLTTGATDDDIEALDWDDQTAFINTLQPSFECFVALDQASDVHAEIGLIEASGGDDGDYICFRVDSDTDTNWYLAASASASETTDAGAAASTDEIGLRWRFTSYTSLEWFVSTDGGLTWTSQGVVESNVPTVALQPYVSVQVRADGGARYIDINRVEIWQDKVWSRF